MSAPATQVLRDHPRLRWQFQELQRTRQRARELPPARRRSALRSLEKRERSLVFEAYWLDLGGES